jgi:Spy/CpxP family protein refolding chaperone
MREKLNLTDEQVNAMEKERQELETSLVPIKDAIHAKRTELMSLLDTENAYSPKIDVLIGEIGQLQMEMEKNVTRHSFTTKKILSPEQQKQFHAMLRHGFQKKHPGPRGKMPFGNPSPF